jgi:hypothetical protein
LILRQTSSQILITTATEEKNEERRFGAAASDRIPVYPGQVANYAGFAPRVDCSGETERYGSIARHQFCHAIRGIVLEGVWAMVRSGKGPLFDKFTSLAERMSRKKSAVAVARKMVILARLEKKLGLVVVRPKELYGGKVRDIRE